jgi:acylphosphatase
VSEGAQNPKAVRATVRGRVQGVGFRQMTRHRARRLGVMGWVRNAEDGSVLVHAEGPADAVDGLVDFLGRGPRGAAVEDIATESAKVEGHEQFAIRGVK